ncbi:MAG: HEAT repeat domain-containing protein, partial [Thermoanaerobaculia bacterium]
MNGIIFLLISGISGACILYGLLQSARESGDERLRFWQKAAKSCGLQVVEVSGYLEARAGLINVRIEDARDQERPKSRLVVEGPAPPDFQHVMIRPEPRIRFGREIEIGDLRFDSTFFIVGPARLVLALLDAEVRSLLLATSAEGLLEISYGKLEAVVPDEKVPEVLPLLVDIRKRFIAPMDIPRRLADNVSRDPWAGVRLKNLLLLIRELPDDPATARALRKACSDPNPEIRLRAAKQLGPEGHGTLLKVARDLRDDAVSAEAVSTLDRELPLKRARSILVQALSLNRLRTARACLQVLGHSG